MKKIYKHALKESGELHELRNQSTWLNNLGQCHRTLAHIQETPRRLRDAERSFQDAIALAQKIAYSDAERIAQTNLGHLYAQDLNDISRSLSCYKAAIKLLEQTRDIIVEESHKVGFFGEGIDAYYGLTSLYLSQAEWGKALITVERARSRTLMEQLAQTSLSTPANVPLELLGEESRLLTELRRLRMALLQAPEQDISTLHKQIATIQQALAAVFEQMTPLAPDYVAIRHATRISYDNIRDLLCIPASKKRTNAAGSFRVI